MSGPPNARMSNSYCVVTGANSGIGREITRGLMDQGAHVVMACRNMESCEHVRASLVAEDTGGSCECARLDLEDFDSVHSFASAQRQALSGSGRQLAVLVNNAGVMNVPDTATGHDRHMTANHYGPFLLTRLLLPSMTKGSRIVTVSSRAHFGGELQFDADGNVGMHPTWWFYKYARSKLANVVFTAELQRRLEPLGITAYATSPGPVNTSLFRTFPFQWLIQPLANMFARTPKQGAQSSVWAASSPELEGRNVLFIHDDKPMEPSALAKDPDVGLKLWEASERFVELDDSVEGGKFRLSRPNSSMK